MNGFEHGFRRNIGYGVKMKTRIRRCNLSVDTKKGVGYEVKKRTRIW